MPRRRGTERGRRGPADCPLEVLRRPLDGKGILLGTAETSLGSQLHLESAV